jgi:hypothetical protein
VSRAARSQMPILAHLIALPITLVSYFKVELAALLLLAGVWFICTVLFSTGSPL